MSPLQPEDCIFANKPSGLLTHTDGSESGFLDFYKAKGNRDLKVVHRLDKETSGCLIFAKTTETTQKLTELFTERKIQKTYFFLTDRPIPKDSALVKGKIEKVKKQWVFSLQDESEKPHSETLFEKVEDRGKLQLWKASPLTGKTHQIRLHAKHLGIPILGDQTYGGSPFVRLMLHCAEMKFDSFSHKASLPSLFELCNQQLSPLQLSWLNQLEYRKALFPELLNSKEQTLRLLDDKENSGYACDKLGDQLWFYRFRDGEIKDDETSAIEFLFQQTKTSHYFIRQMANRGQTPELEGQKEQKNWTAKEGEVQYQLAHGRGWSPGLFLDQRENRFWVKEQAMNKNFLNLFCYTAGFSVNAALGGAREVVSVDTSKTTLEWAKENFSLNALAPDKYEFWSSDARFFLQGCLRKERKFDLIVCDPPSFARSKKGIFRIENEAADLVQKSLQCLNSKGSLLFSCNYEKWSRSEFLALSKKWAKGFSVKEVLLRPPAWDYSLNLPMKSVLIRLT